MRLLFELDYKDYYNCKKVLRRDSARSIIIKGNKVGMIYISKHKCYKFPGGGIEPGETRIQAMMRETREEAGKIVIPNSIREYGYVHIIHKDSRDKNMVFIQDNFYYLCNIEDGDYSTSMDDYEKREGFSFRFVNPKAAIWINSNSSYPALAQIILERDSEVLKYLLKEGIVK